MKKTFLWGLALIGCWLLVIEESYSAVYSLTIKAENCSDSITFPLASGSEKEIEAVAITGYHFTGWSDGVLDNPRTITVISDSTIIAHFAKNTYTVNGEEYEYGETITLTAADKPCYHFTQWSDGNTDNPRTVTVTGDATYTEEYAIDQYNITFQNEDGTPLQQGMVDCGELPVYAGETPTKAAMDEYTYTFDGWNKTIVVASEDAVYTATYSSTKNTYTVNGEEYEYGETVTLTAADKPCYHFTQWSDGNADNPRTVTVTGDATYTEEYAVNHIDLPQVLVYPRVVDGDTLHLAAATASAWEQIDQLAYGSEVTDLWWEWNIGNGFVSYQGGRVNAKNVVLRYGIEACEGKQYSAASGSQQPEPATADNCTDCANVPAVALYEWLIMVDQKTLNQCGYTLDPAQVIWYKVVGKVDNLSDAQGEHNDQKVAEGLYLTAKSPLTGTGRYYAVIKPSAITAAATCKGLLRTEVFDFSTNGKVSMYPTVVASSKPIQLTGLTANENMQVLVYDQVGVLRRSFTTGGREHMQFESEVENGRYIVKIVGPDGAEVFKYVVK